MENNNENKRNSILNKDNICDKDIKKRNSKKVLWDEEKLAEQALERKLHPKQKINDPKTPYAEIADDETEEYLLKLKEVHNNQNNNVNKI